MLVLLRTFARIWGLIDHLIFALVCSLKIFIPVTILAFAVLVPVNWTGGTLDNLGDKLTFSDIDKLSISNVASRSERWEHMFFHWLLIYLIPFHFLFIVLLELCYSWQVYHFIMFYIKRWWFSMILFKDQFFLFF